MNEDRSAETAYHEHTSMVRIMLRPMGSPLPMGFLGLAVATTGFSALQLGLVPEDETRIVALAALLVTVPLMALASVFGVLARDPVASTSMGVLGGIWALLAVVKMTTEPGTQSTALGLLLIVAGMAVLVPIVGALQKVMVAIVMIGSGLRFSLTGLSEMTSSPVAETAAGAAGLVLAFLALYTALALELEDSKGYAVLPLFRHGDASLATRHDIGDQTKGLARETGVRAEL
ncbi:GPR1/FUN34/YaaH family transporter [Nocardiopsis kunsanensis]|uniref:GPR1/FUN34/YaaH family transporter n=1 Tax=Nocardiopsis kunsanensis TaxID=141693 RepID=UPI000346DA90|nr:GPR1/FUN34/YaaH family transporter [Nocardiopsis kunsanensis]